MYDVFLAVYNTALALFLGLYFLDAGNMLFAAVWGFSALVYSPAIYKTWKSRHK